MKNFILFLFVFYISLELIGQSISNLNGYKYVYVPTVKYASGPDDIWGVSARLRNYFEKKGFIVIVDKAGIDMAFDDDPCLILNCSISHTGNTVGTNSVTLSIKNCKEEIVYSNTGRAMGLSLQDDYNKATKKAFGNIDDLKYKFNNDLTPIIEYPKVEITSETETTLKSYFDNNKLNNIEGIYKSYQSEGMGYYKLAIKKRDDKYIAIILETEERVWKLGEIKAYFEPSSMNGFYSVKWYMGNKTPFETFGIMENDGLLSIEFKSKEGVKTQDKFIKMYPVSDIKGAIKKSTGASGSGFFITHSGLIATNAHVIEGAKTIDVSLSNEVGNFTYKARIVLNDSKNDVALIQIDDEKFKGLSSLPYGISEKADIGEKAFTIGYPLNDIMGTNYKVNDGIISAKSGINDDVRYYQISVPLQPGNSGGPLFNKDGNVIGITSAKLSSKAVGTLIENVNYAIKSTYLSSLINMMPNATSPPPSTQLVGKELQEQVKILKNYVCIIQVN